MAVTSEIAKKNILIIEDEIAILHMIKGALRDKGFENLLEAQNGVKALAMMKKKKIDLTICDWSMPNMTGLELFNTMQSDAKLKNISFILVTGNTQKDKVAEALTAGIKHYFAKPFISMRLIEKVVELLQEEKGTEAA